jgi:hypothetical protein
LRWAAYDQLGACRSVNRRRGLPRIKRGNPCRSA